MAKRSLLLLRVRAAVFGPLRHLVRCSDLVAIGAEADIVQTLEIGCC
jgi:hypothetical protein